MKTALLFLVVLLLWLLFSFARSNNVEKPVNISWSQDPRHYHPLRCKPTTNCLANGGYCIRNNHKEDCEGLLFSRECRSPLCSCCVEATLKRDECQDTPGICPNGISVCQDKDVGYECTCNAGFETTVCGGEYTPDLYSLNLKEK
ncbi:neurogenic locus notch homolog protein 1-like [Macrobrachium nipponense]|uniref:neurogenic locus notch homolog protein 1-like n=1 Tax=Macrobrachium nipponense TaxID=159736 RepID=UPI0030C8D04F